MVIFTILGMDGESPGLARDEGVQVEKVFPKKLTFGTPKIKLRKMFFLLVMGDCLIDFQVSC